MYVKIRPLDGMQQLHINISKTATIIKLKDEIEKQLSVKPELQRLYFRGKHMENENTLFDCKVNVNDVIQLSVRSEENVSTKPVQEVNKKGKKNKTDEAANEDLVDAESYYYKVGDAIDCIDQIHGAWFEAKIEKISMKNSSEDLIYTVRWEFIEYAEPFNVTEKYIRPRAWKILRPEELKKGHKVMVNHNLDRRLQIGYWYDFEIGNILINGSVVSLTGTLYIGSDAEELQKRKVLLKKYPYAIEEPELIRDRDELKFRTQISKESRAIAANCSKCLDAPTKKCRECSCKVCGGKGDPSRIILCDECDSEYHIDCLSPPLKEIPKDDWYCPKCKNEVNDIIKVGDVLKKRASKNDSTGKRKKDWGMGMACVGRTKSCTIVPANHRGPIPGIEVGSSWLYRVGVSEAGVHQPPVAGIHGRETDCAYSIVVSDGYGDIDNGNEFLYTGSGGRDLSGNKRTAKQTSDQELTRANKALALNCNVEFNNTVGATASDWRGGIPVRVVRTYKLAKFSKYAPKEGNRYDGIYKVVKYFPEINEDGYRIWRFLLRRDDPIPAPWTTEGQWRIKQLGLKMQVPDGFEERENCNESNKKSKGKTQRPSTSPSDKKKRQKAEEYQLDTNVSELIDKDHVNSKLWKGCKTHLLNGKTEFLQHVSELFLCVCCQELVFNPVTTPCAHNICRSCLKRSFSAGVYSCPTCRHSLHKNYRINVNKNLSMILILLFPGYESGRR